MLKKILLVDDSSLIHKIYRGMLLEYNCVFSNAMNGQEALDILAEQQDIDLILLDINMPVMNGLQFMEKAAANGIASKIPVIIISTEGKEADTTLGLKLGARGYLKKPFQLPELRKLIDQIYN